MTKNKEETIAICGTEINVKDAMEFNSKIVGILEEQLQTPFVCIWVPKEDPHARMYATNLKGQQLQIVFEDVLKGNVSYPPLKKKTMTNREEIALKIIKRTVGFANSLVKKAENGEEI